MAQLGTFTPPPARGDGDLWKPKEHLDIPVIIKVNKKETGVITENAPEGTDAVIVDLVDLGAGEVFRDVMMFGGGVVDPLSGYIGQAPMVVKFTGRKSKSGRTYPVPVPGDPNEIAYAQTWLDQQGDPFVPTLGSMKEAQAAAPTPGPVEGPPPPWAAGQPAAAPAPTPAATPAPAAAPPPWKRQAS